MKAKKKKVFVSTLLAGIFLWNISPYLIEVTPYKLAIENSTILKLNRFVKSIIIVPYSLELPRSVCTV